MHIKYKKAYAMIKHMLRKANKLRKETLAFVREVTV